MEDQELVDRGLASLEARARVSVLIIYLYIAITLALSAVDIAAITGAIELHALPTQAWVDAIRGLAYSQTVTFIVSAIIISFWIYRAHKNLFDAGYDYLEFTPGWSIGWFAVPFASLYMPYRAMRELWHVSLGEGRDLSGPAPSELIIWWACFLLGNFAAYGAALPVIELLSNLLSIAAAWFLKIIISRVTQSQPTTLRLTETFA
jgi:hypothetical protein